MLLFSFNSLRSKHPNARRASTSSCEHYAAGAAKHCAHWQLRSAAPRRLGCQADPVVARPFDLDGSEDRQLILRVRDFHNGKSVSQADGSN